MGKRTDKPVIPFQEHNDDYKEGYKDGLDETYGRISTHIRDIIVNAFIICATLSTILIFVALIFRVMIMLFAH